MAGSVLAGIRVLDIGRYIAGPFCAALLGDLGADVIRVERVGGGEDRWVTPVATGGDGALFMQVNRNKRSLALDLGSPQGLEVLRRQIERADVVVANMPLRTLRKLGLDYEHLSAGRPDIILTTATAFGPGGPLSDKVGFDGVAQAMSGAVHISGLPGQPAKLMMSYVDYGTALACAFGTVAALYERRDTGAYCLIQECSRAATRLPHQNAPVAPPRRPVFSWKMVPLPTIQADASTDQRRAAASVSVAPAAAALRSGTNQRRTIWLPDVLWTGRPGTREPGSSDGGCIETRAQSAPNPNNSSDRPKSAQATKHLGQRFHCKKLHQTAHSHSCER